MIITKFTASGRLIVRYCIEALKLTYVVYPRRHPRRPPRRAK